MRLVLVLLSLLSVTAQAGTLSIPQLADGATWKTTITVFSRSSRTAQVSILFFGDDGKPLALPIVGQGSVTSLQANLGPYDSATFETEGISNTLLVGYGHVESDNEVGGVAVFRQRVPGSQDTEGAVPFTPPGTSVITSFDNTAGFITGVAIVNHGFGPVTLNIGFTAEGGQPISSRVYVLNPKFHTSFELAKQFPEVAGRRGTMQITGMTYQGLVEASISVVGLRFNPRGSFTTLPVFGSILR